MLNVEITMKDGDDQDVLVVPFKIELDLENDFEPDDIGRLLYFAPEFAQLAIVSCALRHLSKAEYLAMLVEISGHGDTTHQVFETYEIFSCLQGMMDHCGAAASHVM